MLNSDAALPSNSLVSHNGDTERETVIELKNVCKLYGGNKNEAAKMMKNGSDKESVYKKNGVTVALWDVNLSIKRGEIFVIIGLSGSGKSTLVRCLNMLHRPTSGNITVDGNEIVKMDKKELIAYRREKTAMVFQGFGLMSHRDVLGNIAYGLEIKKIPKAQREEKALKLLHMVGLEGMERQPISSLSGGMRQRVGIARALANDPDVLLMDEPFSALDPLVRRDMQFELLSIQRKLEKTVVFITHDINEAFKLGDTVAIMRDGMVVQVATPEEMFENPADDYVRLFVDSADRTKVLSAKQVMVTPSCIARQNDAVGHTIQEMKRNGVSSAYAVDSKMRFRGVITIDEALRAKNERIPMHDLIITDVPTTLPDTPIGDIMPIMAEARFPMAVVDDENKLKGIISKAAILSSLG